MSDPDNFDRAVDLTNVVEVIDHRQNEESHKYWREITDAAVQIEEVGAAATLVYEKWASSGLLGNLNTSSAKLLFTAIIENTLGLKARIATPRDRVAYNKLLPLSGLSDTWIDKYFMECQRQIEKDTEKALINDTKEVYSRNIRESIIFAQLAVYSTENMSKNISRIGEIMNRKYNLPWVVNIISTRKNRSYFITQSRTIKHLFTQLLGVKFSDDTGFCPRLWLRKEIAKIV